MQFRAYCDAPEDCPVCEGEQSEIAIFCEPQFANKLRQMAEDAGHADARLEQLRDVSGGIFA